MSLGRADRLDLVKRVALVLRDDPCATANAVYQRVGRRRRDVLRVVRAHGDEATGDGVRRA